MLVVARGAAELPLQRPGSGASQNEQFLTKVVNALKGHPGLLAWKGIDEPRNPFRGADWIRPAGLVGLREGQGARPGPPARDHPGASEHDRGARAYRPAFDITGANIYPVAYPPGPHADTGNTDISVVGDVARKMTAAAGTSRSG